MVWSGTSAWPCAASESKFSNSISVFIHFCKKLRKLDFLIKSFFTRHVFQFSLVFSYSRSCWPRSTQEDWIKISKDCINIWVLDCINILSIRLHQYSRYWIESIFQVLDWINIPGIGLNHENKKIELNKKKFLGLDWMLSYAFLFFK